MSFKIQSELPRLRVPAAFMIDDSAVEQKDFYLYLVHLWRLIRKYRLKGKMSITPYVRDRGPLDDKRHPPLSRTVLRKLVRTLTVDFSPYFDITPEMITHSKTFNLKTGELMDIPEWEWSRKQSVASLTAYLSRAIAMLQNVGIKTNGLTSPVDFGKRNEQRYAQAVSKSALQCNRRSIAWYYLNNEQFKPAPAPVVTYLSPDKKKCAIDVVSCLNDQLLFEIVGARGIKVRRIRLLADRYISPDGKKGRLVTVIRHGGYCVFHTHWWALYNHGKKRGFKVYNLIFQRLRKYYSHRLFWMKPSEIAQYRAAGVMTAFQAKSSAAGVTVTIKSATDCPDFTFSITPLKKPVKKIVVGSKLLRQVFSREKLADNCWWQDGRTIHICSPLAASSAQKFGLHLI